MLVSQYSHFNTRRLTDINDVAQGNISDCYVIPGGIVVTNGSKVARHGVAISTGRLGDQAITSSNQGNLAGGVAAVAAVAYVKTITVADYSLLVADTSTLTVGTKTYLFKSSGATGDQINIGASNNATASNIRTKINTDLVTGELQSTAVSNALITLTGLASGATFALSTNASSALTLATTTTGNAASSGTAASCEISLEGRFFIAGTQTEIMFPSVAYPVESDTFISLYFRYVTQTGDGPEEILTELKALLDAVLMDTTLPDASTHLFSTSLFRYKKADLALALQAIFGDDPGAAFAISGTGDDTVLTLTAGDVGTGYNKVAVVTEVENSVPGPLITFGEDTAPDELFAFHQGGTRGFKVNLTHNTSDIAIDNSKIPMGTIMTADAAQCEYSLVQSLNPRLQKVIGGNAGYGLAQGFDLVQWSARNSLDVYGIVNVMQSKLDTSVLEVTVIFQANFIGGLPIMRGQTDDSAMAANAKPLPLANSPGCMYGYTARVNLLRVA
jgi:hypothetical protein